MTTLRPRSQSLAAALLLSAAVLVAAPPRATAAEPQPLAALASPDLQAAIEADDANAVARAIDGGADPKAAGEAGIAPLLLALGRGKGQAARVLLERGADPNATDAAGNSGVTLAVRMHDSAPGLLELVLNFGGNPNARDANGEPAAMRFVDTADLDGLVLMQQRGADLNAEVGGRPLIVLAALAGDWDIAWRMAELGARTDSDAAREGLLRAFLTPEATPPGNPRYDAKLKLYRRLKDQGLAPVPPLGVPG